MVTTPEELGFEVGPEGRNVHLTPSREGLQLLIERRAEFEASLAVYDDIIMEYPHIQTVAMPPDEDAE